MGMQAKRRVLKSLKDVSFKVEDYIIVGHIEIPIVSRSIAETSKILSSINKVKLPKKTRHATLEEYEELKKTDSTLKSIPMITVYDNTNEEYQRKSMDIATNFKILEKIGQYIDMDCETETGTIWSDWEIPRGDWNAVASYISANFNEKEIESMEISIKAKFGDRVHILLAKLEEMSGKSAIEILRVINRVSDIEKLEEELRNKSIALKEMEEEIYNILDTFHNELNEDAQYNEENGYGADVVVEEVKDSLEVEEIETTIETE